MRSPFAVSDSQLGWCASTQWQCIPQETLFIAEMLFRHPLADSEQSDLKEEVEAYIDGVEGHLAASCQKLQQIADVTRADEELQSLLKYVQQGWPKHVKAVPTLANRGFWTSWQGFSCMGQESWSQSKWKMKYFLTFTKATKDLASVANGLAYQYCGQASALI